MNGEADSNSADVVGAIRSLYGEEVGNAFNGLWRSEGHIPAFIAYTQAVAKNDVAGADKAVTQLLAYAKTFGETMSQVNENLPAAAVEEAIGMHATTLKEVVDAQKAKDATGTATRLRVAAHHMSDTANVLAEATTKKFPEEVLTSPRTMRKQATPPALRGRLVCEMRLFRRTFRTNAPG